MLRRKSSKKTTQKKALISMLQNARNGSNELMGVRGMKIFRPHTFLLQRQGMLRGQRHVSRGVIGAKCMQHCQPEPSSDETIK